MPTRGNLLSALLLSLIFFCAAFAQSEKKTAYCVLLDNTGSLRSQFNTVVELGQGVVERISQQGPVSLFSFTTQGDVRNGQAVAALGIKWSQDRLALGKYIDNLYVEPGRTTLFDAVYSIAEYLNAKVSSERDALEGKAIILITDGEDRVSKVKDKQLIERLKESGIKVYAVGLIQELESNSGLVGRGSREKAENFLRSVAKETGGNVIFSKSGKADVDRLLNELFAASPRK